VARRELGPHKRIQLDGGVGPDQARAVLDAGGDVLVAASAIFKRSAGERAGVIASMRTGANGA